MAKTTGWDPPYAILAVLLFVLMLAAAFVLAASSIKAVSGVGQNLISELIGFLLTAWVVGWLFKRQEAFRRDAHTARRKAVLSYQIRISDERLKHLLVGQSAFGVQYVPELRKALSALERLDFDCAELLSAELQGDIAEKVAHFHQLTRDLISGLESVQNDLLVRPPSGSPLPLSENAANLIANWRKGAHLVGDEHASGDPTA